MAAKKSGLGRGLTSLFDENASDNEGAVKVNINDIEPNRDQPRKDFDETALSELAESISQHGLIQPIVVKPTLDGRYSIVAGERRWRACRIAGLDEVPVVIKEADEQTLMEIALIENLQREDLNAVEEALGYRSLIDTYGLTQEEVAKKMGKSRSAVTNALRLPSTAMSLRLYAEELYPPDTLVLCSPARTRLSVPKCCLRRQTEHLCVSLKKRLRRLKKQKRQRQRKMRSNPLFTAK